ncbi:hypothetical protein N9Y92_02560, partial [Chlamydiales bacterium]|nr:hypothetical protein [Chlamydiales bacterium]
WMFGGPIIGIYASRLNTSRTLLIITPILAFLTLSPVIYLTFLEIGVVLVLLFMTGFFSGGQLLTFSKAVILNPPYAKGSAIASVNFIVMLGGAIAQPFVGYLLDLSGQNYQTSLVCFPLSLLLASVLSVFIKK